MQEAWPCSTERSRDSIKFNKPELCLPYTSTMVGGGAHPGKEDPNISCSDRNEKRRRGTLQERITAAETGVRENCL